MLDGGGHDAARVVAPLTGLPAVDLLQSIGGGLPGDDRLTRACALAFGSMAGGAGGDPSCCVAGQPDRRRRGG